MSQKKNAEAAVQSGTPSGAYWAQRYGIGTKMLLYRRSQQYSRVAAG